MKFEISNQGKKAKKKMFVILLLFLIMCTAGFGIYALATFNHNSNQNPIVNESSRGEFKKLVNTGKAVNVNMSHQIEQ